MLMVCYLRLCSFALEQYLCIYNRRPRFLLLLKLGRASLKQPAQQLYTYVWTFSVVVIIVVVPIKQMSVGHWRFSVGGAAATCCYCWWKKAFVSNNKFDHSDLSITTFLYVRWDQFYFLGKYTTIGVWRLTINWYLKESKCSICSFILL